MIILLPYLYLHKLMNSKSRVLFPQINYKLLKSISRILGKDMFFSTYLFIYVLPILIQKYWDLNILTL